MSRADTVPEKVQEAIFNDLLSRPENQECADCNSKSPTWVSIDFGVFVCIRCSGIISFIIPIFLYRSPQTTWTSHYPC